MLSCGTVQRLSAWLPVHTTAGSIVACRRARFFISVRRETLGHQITMPYVNLGTSCLIKPFHQKRLHAPYPSDRSEISETRASSALSTLVPIQNDSQVFHLIS